MNYLTKNKTTAKHTIGVVILSAVTTTHEFETVNSLYLLQLEPLKKFWLVFIVETVVFIRYTLYVQRCMNYNKSFDRQPVKVVYVTATLQRPLCTRLKRSIFYNCSNVTKYSIVELTALPVSILRESSNNKFWWIVQKTVFNVCDSRINF